MRLEENIGLHDLEARGLCPEADERVNRYVRRNIYYVLDFFHRITYIIGIVVLLFSHSWDGTPWQCL